MTLETTKQPNRNQGYDNVKLSHFVLIMNDLTLPNASSDLGARIAALNAVVRQLSDDAQWLRAEAKRLRTEHARTRLGNRMPLWFLLQLQHEEFPVRVFEPGEVRYVSVLTATGLVEAEIGALEATGRYAPSRAATVRRITEYGHAEIARIEDMPEPAPASTLPAPEVRAV